MNDLIFIPKEDMPTKAYGVTLKRPKFSDYNKAWKLYPAQSRVNTKGPGYDFEDFFCALCLRTPDGKEPDNSPQDAIRRFSEIDSEDKDFIINTFLSCFFLTQETNDAAESYGDDLLMGNPGALTFSIPKEDLPLQSASIVFNRPNSSVQLQARRSYESAQVNGCPWSDFYLVHCIRSLDGIEIKDLPPNPTALLADIDLLDVQFLSAMFTSMFSGARAMQKASELGKTLRAKLLTPSPSTKTKSTSAEKSTSEPVA